MSRNVPELRFPGFSGEWEEIKIGDLLAIKHGKSQKEVEDKEGKYPILGTGGIMGKATQYLYDKNSVLIGRKGTINRPMYISEPFWTVDTLFYSKVKNSNNAKYIYYLFWTINWIKYNEASGVPSLNRRTIESINVYSTHLKEQEKIASFFSLLDKRIEKQKEKIEQLQQLKKGFMQKIFSQEIRFKDEDGSEYTEWEEVNLGDIAITFSGGTPLVSKRDYYNGKIPFIRSGEINKGETELYITESGLNNSSAKLVNKGDVLYALYGATSGEVAVSRITGAINQAVLCIKTEVNNVYLVSYLNHIKDRIIATYLQGGQGNLSGKIVRELNIKLPNKVEQNKICFLLSEIDDKINKESKKIRYLKEEKKGFLQKMFV